MGNKRDNIIEINGKRYDAVSGSLLGTGAAAGKGTGFSIDGFTRTHGHSTHTDLQQTKTAAPHKKAVHAKAAHIAPHQPERSKTLMRTSVKKPLIKAPATIAAKSRTDIAVKTPKHEVAPKLSHYAVDPARKKRAERVIKSPAVSRFGRPTSMDAIAPYSPALHLAATPAKPNLPPHIPVQSETQSIPAPDIFQQVLSRAPSQSHPTTHRVKKVQKHPAHRRRLALATSVSLVFLLILGIFAYVNVPAISLRMASAKAGFQAKLPAYSPVGFRFGNLSYGPGNVTVSYKDSSMNERQFDIQQRVTGWDDNALLNNFVANANKAYQTYERAGRTIYLYGNNTATWVQSGVWYTIDGSNSLTRNQVLDMAGSL